MGHYDTCYDNEKEKENKFKEKQRKALLKKIIEDIKERGIENVLTDIVLNTTI